MAQFLPGVAGRPAVLQDEVGQDDVEAVAPDLADDLAELPAPWHHRDAQGGKHDAQRFPRRAWRSTKQNPFLVSDCCRTSSISSLSRAFHASQWRR